MSDMSVHILGCGSATPSLRHKPSSQVVQFHQRLFMVDCGEGAQLQLRRMHLKFSRLNHIFLSHLHGDHCFGLPGLLSTMALHEKGGTVTVHVFEEGIKLLRDFIGYFCRDTPFDIVYEPVSHKGGIVYEDNSLIVEAFPLYHRVAAVGYLFRQKPQLRHMRGDMINYYNIPHYAIPAIKEGADWTTPDGRVIPNEHLTTAPSPSVSYAYASDTKPDRRVAEAVAGVDLLYHEATYASDQAHKAGPRGHSTAAEAAEIARRAGVGQLILGHFSKSYASEDMHLAEAETIFPNTIIANEGMVVDVVPKQ